MSDRFAERMGDDEVAHDTRVVADFTRMFCDGHHRDRARRTVATQATALGVYGAKVPVLCEECAAHLEYAEKRRAYCRMDPKPFCAHCPVHCYQTEERTWHADMMRYSGPRSWRSGHLIDLLRHKLEERRLGASRSADTSNRRPGGVDPEEMQS